MAFHKLPSNSKQLLDDLLQAENPSEMLCRRYDSLCGKAQDELHGVIRELCEEGYIDVFWADNLPCEVAILNPARTYHERLAEYEAEKTDLSSRISSPVPLQTMVIWFSEMFQAPRCPSTTLFTNWSVTSRNSAATTRRNSMNCLTKSRN